MGMHTSRQWAPAVIAVCVVGLSAGQSAGALAPSFQGVGFVSGADASRAFGVSADSRAVVGVCEIPPPPGEVEGHIQDVGFLWTSDQGIRRLSAITQPPGGTWIIPEANGVASPAGVPVVVGGADTGSGTVAFRWTEAGGLVGLGSLTGGADDSSARAISADGGTVVGWAKASSLHSEAFRWTEASGMVGLGHLYPDDGHPSTANAVSADGSAVAGSSASPDGWQAFRWTEGTGMVGLGDLAGGDFWSEALAVSADGSVVVGWSESDSGREAFRWTEAEGMQAIGDGFRSAANGASADGSVIVGGSEGVLGGAFIWTEDVGAQSLQHVLVDDVGLDLTGWTLESATAISPDGLVIVGNGVNPDGSREAWVATIPEPGTLTMLVLGAFTLWCGHSKSASHGSLMAARKHG